MSSHDFHDPVVGGYNDDLSSLISCLATTFGDEVGQAVNEKITAVLQLEGVDIAAVTAQIATLNSLMQSGNASDAATAQAIVSQLTSLSSRITSLESSTAVAQLTAAVAAIQDAVAVETAARVAADAANAAAIASVAASVTTLQTTIATLEASVASGGGSGGCDCTAINTSIAQVVSDVTALKASDASQATAIADLTTRIQALEVKSADIATAIAAAAAAAAKADAASAKADTASAKADAAKAAADAAKAAVKELDDRNEEQHGHFIHKNEIKDIDCVAIGHAFRAAMRSKMNLS
ncbi:hypothetical protein UFOVP92_28 [uncultured Caudovirales phage]|uniref:Uncharacterized protein n=1 Tax=uncultured Caudovirales phage TaxID=2100421 RepID=A0A6J5L1Q3_9CAUD|nr:hypothetical protein UFOVP92_28 [uncultured Caudovirales phage]